MERYWEEIEKSLKELETDNGEKEKLFYPMVKEDDEYLRSLVMESTSESETSETNNSSKDEEDYLEVQLENTDTEQDVASEEDSEKESKAKKQKCKAKKQKFVFGKDKKTKWNLERPMQNVITHAHYTVTHVPSVIGNAAYAKSALECWNVFFTDDLLAIIVENTNKYIDSKKKHFGRERDCKPTDLLEIKAFFGLLYMIGFHRKSKLSIKDLWSADGSGVELFRLVMSHNRFHFLLRTISFDDEVTRNERKLLDKLAPIRQVFDMFVLSCHDNYLVGEYVTVDEMLVAFRGKCSFRQYIASKSGKYGIKMFSLVDTRMLYTLNLEVYVGKQPDGPFQVSNNPHDIVKRLCMPIRGSGRNVTGDNWFTSYELIRDLLKTDQLTYVGAVRKDTPELPRSFVSSHGREQCTTHYCFQKDITLLSYIPKKGKNVLLFYSFHQDSLIDEAAGTRKKPNILNFYDTTKSSVDVLNKLCSTYSVSKATSHWPMAIFYVLLNVAAVNAQVIHRGNKNPGLQKRRHFIKALALELVSENLKKRSQISCLPREIRKRSAEIITEFGTESGKDEPGTSYGVEKKQKTEYSVEDTKTSRKRCYICERKKNRMTKNRCNKCNNFICLEHAKYICIICSNKNN